MSEKCPNCGCDSFVEATCIKDTMIRKSKKEPLSIENHEIINVAQRVKRCLAGCGYVKLD